MVNFVLVIHSLWLVSTVQAPGDYECQRLDGAIPTCINNPRVRIAKTEKNYKLSLCANNNCIPTDYAYRIKCKNICPFCMSLPGRQDIDCSSDNQCEQEVDMFLNGFCASATPTTYTSTVTDRALTTCTPMVNPQKTDSHMKVDMGTPVAVLGALAGLLTMALALVVGGWVWTCWSMKKRSDRTQLHTKCQDCEEKRSYPNPTYGMTTENKPAVGTTTQLHSQEKGNGQMHNTINTDDNQQCQVRNEIEEGGREEEHTYHVLEKPGNDDYEDPDKDLEENTAIEYETPVPLRDPKSDS